MNNKAKAVAVILSVFFLALANFSLAIASSDFVVTPEMKSKIMRENTYSQNKGITYRVRFVKFLDDAVFDYNKHTTFVGFERDFFLTDKWIITGEKRYKRETIFAIILHNSSGKWKIDYAIQEYIEEKYPGIREKFIELGYF